MGDLRRLAYLKAKPHSFPITECEARCVSIFTIMKQRMPGFVFAPTSVDEAEGVTIKRAIGGERLAILDPFILLDHARIEPGSDVVGFPRHPHRGIETLSYVIAGEVGHKDSKGNEGKVGPGGSQWMTAGDGIFHEEMLIAGPDGAEFLQLWFSLPREQKRIPAAYIGAPALSIPQLIDKGVAVRVVAGAYGETEGVFRGIAVNPTVLYFEVPSSANLEFESRPGEAAFIYAVRGSFDMSGVRITSPSLAVLTDGDSVSLTSGAEGTQFLFVSSMPLQEPILQYRSFVMNTVEDIRETLDLIESGSFA